jgi:hypothetical protein
VTPSPSSRSIKSLTIPQSCPRGTQRLIGNAYRSRSLISTFLRARRHAPLSVLTCADGESATTKVHLDFGIAYVMPFGPVNALYLVKFNCGCAVFVGGGRVLWRAGAITPLCEHVAAK